MKPHAVREALKPELSYLEARLVWALRAALVAFMVYGVVARNPAPASRELLLGAPAAGLVASLLFAFVRTDRPRTLKASEAVLLGAVFMHVGGHAFGFYRDFEWYDHALHFVVPLVTALVFYALSQATDWIWDWRKVTPLEVGIYIFAMAVTVGTLWEIMEFGMDRLLGTREQKGLVDTMVDLMMDVAGALFGASVAAWATWYGRAHGHDKVSEDPNPQATRGGGIAEPRKH